MDSFPTLSCSPGLSAYVELLSREAVIRANAASGYPVANKQFTFDPKTFQFSLYTVSQGDKESVMAFYISHKDVPFNWSNIQEGGQTYEVVFGDFPECRLQDSKDLWEIKMMLIQMTPLT